MWRCKSQTLIMLRYNEKLWLYDAVVSVVQQTGLLLGAALLSVLLCGTQLVASDSDELLLTEWEIWKSSNGIAYDDMVIMTLGWIQKPTSDSLKCVYNMLSFVLQDDMQRQIIWEENKQMIENNNQGFFRGMRPFTMAMNKYGDLVRSTVFLSMIKVPLPDLKCI